MLAEESLCCVFQPEEEDPDRGQPCTRCGDQCPGFRVHGWRYDPDDACQYLMSSLSLKKGSNTVASANRLILSANISKKTNRTECLMLGEGIGPPDPVVMENWKHRLRLKAQTSAAGAAVQAGTVQGCEITDPPVRAAQI